MEVTLIKSIPQENFQAAILFQGAVLHTTNLDIRLILCEYLTSAKIHPVENRYK